MNGNLKRLASLWMRLATKSQLSHYVSSKDREVFTKRLEAEGLSFLTQTLPVVGKGLLAGFSRGFLLTSDFPGWRLKKDKAYPLFLCGAFSELFEGVYLRKQFEDISSRNHAAGAVACIRQLTELFYKLELEPTPEQLAQTTETFKQAEWDVTNLLGHMYSDCIPIGVRAVEERMQYHFDTSTHPSNHESSGLTRRDVRNYAQVIRRAKRLVHWLVKDVNPLEIRPKHGSGSSACRVKPHARYDSYRYIQRIADMYPYDEYFHFGRSSVCDNIAPWGLSEGPEEVEPSARVVFVPKDSRGPRLISEEPREFMYLQQGLNSLLVSAVERNHAVASEVSWLDQGRNRELARLGSIDPSLYVTLDLKEASDRVSWKLVKYLFPKPWRDAFNASRSLSTELPDGEVIPLHKFAPMGSACCFPVMSICLWAIAASASKSYVPSRDDRTFRRNPLLNREHRISVYGDDIIVPTQHAELVTLALKFAGLEVNESKSFTQDIPFRESCGGDYYYGVDVAPVRVKVMPDGNDKRSKHRTVLMANNLIARYGSGIDVMDIAGLIQEWFGLLPITNKFVIEDNKATLLTKGIALIGPHTIIPEALKYNTNRRGKRRRCYRWNTDLHQYETLTWCAFPKSFEIGLTSWGQVLRKELQSSLQQSADYGTIAHRVSYKMSWAAL
jgi:hypothetical protein